MVNLFRRNSRESLRNNRASASGLQFIFHLSLFLLEALEQGLSHAFLYL